MPGFTVVGEAHERERGAASSSTSCEPDLVLLDMYLPDIGGLEVLRAAARARQPAIDVIAITSAKDVKTLRGAMHRGVVHYIVKPFGFATFRERLESYAALRSRLERLQRAGPAGDRPDLLAAARGSDGCAAQGDLGRRRSKVVVDIVREAGDDADGRRRRRARRAQPRHRAALPRVPGRLGDVELTLRYGAAGRPEHLYRWVAAKV